MSTIQQRINNLRQVMQDNDINAIVVPSADPHLSEYLPEYWQGRQWLSGFTGSVGTLVVTADFAGLWADSRYWVQAADQLDGTGIELQKLQKGAPNHADWLAANLKAGDSVAIDGNVLSLAEQDRLLAAFADVADEDDNDDEEYGIRLITEEDLLNQIWEDRPALPSAPLYAHDEQFLSQSAKEKLAEVRAQMQQLEVTHHLISSLDDIAWLTNLRGNDVDYNPVFLAHMLISADSATLYVDTQKVSADIAKLLADAGIEVAEYDQVQAALGQLTPEDLLLLDPNKVAVGTLNDLADDIGMIESIAPSSLLKSVKTDQDIEHIREAMRQDGAALCQFFSEFENRLNQGERLSELDVDSMLIDVRSKQPHYVSPSFPTIAGFNENGALPHYRATEDKFSYIEGDGLLLIDSGAQYQNGTTDITRVVGIGNVNAAQKRDFSIVLKAHIALARACFPDGIASPLIDAICRAPLWQAQRDYGHGTGHGVGYFLNVHEGPQVIAYSATTPPERAMKVGMITSNEPGLYREGRWGIRIENLVVNQPVPTPEESEFGHYLNFETVTLCPIDTRLVDPSVLNQEEIDWLNDYHSHVYNELKDRVEGEALDWLTERTKAI
ncbi:aminopeptidase P family protein [Psychrobacter sp. FDAARGOS_221]|uniref:aminopeptidase P family protein n=1 Tax=Psychrobacter sp. FDAARGOS_221 TaxID=1975705 RepID=UPI000BB534CE|nr:aminopeptidase P family protein [Psychrobacter sp. FDAARGOS_221]PNK60705.1 aminopeptidase P family protein [Psychrobacter sp. FDAARGOS_221]